MFCTRCQNPVADCSCDDIEQRLEQLGSLQGFVSDRCLNCRQPGESCGCGDYEPASGVTNRGG